MGKKSRVKRERKGGQNPGAVPRKSLVGLPPGKQVIAAIQGRFSEEITALGNAMALLREFQSRFKRSLLPRVMRRFGQNLSHEIHIAAGPDGEWAAEKLALNATFTIGEWITSASANDIRELAKFLDCRPIEPSDAINGALWPRPADPAALRAALAAAYAEEESKFPPGTRFVLSKQEALDKCAANHLDERTLRRAAQELSRKKGDPGRPKSDS